MGTGRNRFSINLSRGPARWILASWLASNETFVMLLLGSIIGFLFDAISKETRPMYRDTSESVTRKKVASRVKARINRI